MDACSWQPLYSKLHSEFEFFTLATFPVFSTLWIRISITRLFFTIHPYFCLLWPRLWGKDWKLTVTGIEMFYGMLGEDHMQSQWCFFTSPIVCLSLLARQFINLDYHRHWSLGIWCVHKGWHPRSSDVLAWAWPGFRWLGLEEIVSWAQSQKSGLAWPGFGPSQGFWCICTNCIISHFLTFKYI